MFPSVCPFFSLFSPFSSSLILFSWTCLSLLLCTVGSFSEHLDQINGRSECVDSTDNSSKPSSEPASHMARQRLESTEKKKISGKVTKSLSASALSLMIPGGREISTRMKLCDLCMWPPPPRPQFGMLIETQDCMKLQRCLAQLSRAPCRPSRVPRELVCLISSPFFLHQEMRQASFHKALLLLYVSFSLFFLPYPQVKW